MNDIEVFLNYASAFEVALATDDWSAVRDCFCEDAVYEVEGGPPLGGIWHGRDEIVDHLIDSVNSFDRTYDERLVEGSSIPEMRDGAVHIEWAVTYRKAGEPDLRVEGEEDAWIRDGKIARLKDSMP
jgi:ketosteroid isomerase-like protein